MSVLKQVEVDWLFTPDDSEKFAPKHGKSLVDILAKEVEDVEVDVPH